MVNADLVELQRLIGNIPAILRQHNERRVLAIFPAHVDGVPLYLSGDVVSVAFTEVEDGKTSPKDYEAKSYDFVWFTPRAPREDPCAKF